MGAARVAEADVPRGSARGEDGQGLLRVRRERQEEIDSPELARTDTAKAALWAAISGIASVVGVAFAPGFYPSWYYLLVAVGYGLLLPALAILHVRHATVRESGAILGTAAGVATIAVGIGASASADLAVGALFVGGIWWWTVGKMWAETGVLPRALGVATMALAVIALGTAVATGPLDIDLASLWMGERVGLGLWTLAVSFALWRARASR